MPLSVRDPIHGTIRLADWALPIVESPVLQRLRRIQQLGTAHLVYPGAHHRRFEHSLGAYHLAGRFAQAVGSPDGEAQVAQAAALVHDVGHGPFSHAFEELVREQGRRHEETSVDLVRWGPLGDLLRQGGIDPVAVSQAIVGEGPVGPIVSGALDADRLDYLLRDAHYTGVPSSADPDRLAEVLQLHDGQIEIAESGVLAAEALLTMRFLMYPAVYLHHTVRASESILLAAVRAYIGDGHATLRQVERDTDDGLLNRMRSAGGVGAELVARLDDRRLYKRALEGGPSESGQAWLRRLMDEPRARRKAEVEIAEGAGVPVHHVLLDLPAMPKFRELGVLVRRRDGSVVRLPEASRLVAVLQEARLDHWRYWVFAPKQERDRVGEVARRVLR
ncbi:MAG: HD domain-containing protein [Thermoplasmatota archaeon]